MKNDQQTPLTRDNFHVGIAPFIDATGKRQASFQRLGDGRKADITADFENGKVERLNYEPSVTEEDLEQFLTWARHTEATTKAVDFSNPAAIDAEIDRIERELTRPSPRAPRHDRGPSI